MSPIRFPDSVSDSVPGSILVSGLQSDAQRRLSARDPSRVLPAMEDWHSQGGRLRAYGERMRGFMDFDAAKNASETAFNAFVDALILHAASRLQAGDSPRSVIESFLRTAYNAHLTAEEATDFFCVDAKNVVDSWHTSKAQRDEVVALFDEINTQEVRRRLNEHRDEGTNGTGCAGKAGEV